MISGVPNASSDAMPSAAMVATDDTDGVPNASVLPMLAGAIDTALKGLKKRVESAR